MKKSTPTLKPFFSFFGGKWKAAKRYPWPIHEVVVEPFAGAAGYSTRFCVGKKAKLYDLDPIVAGVWEYLIGVEETELENLPLWVPDEGVGVLDIDDRAKWLVGFWLGRGQSTPLSRPGAWMRTGNYPTHFWGQSIKDRLIRQVQYIRDWEVKCCSYEDIDVENVGESCWFVDPPYQDQGNGVSTGTTYTKGSSGIDYIHLADWCERLPGQVLVCENEGAHWKDGFKFEPITVINGTRNTPSKEVLWKKGC